MSFGSPSGPPASAKQISYLLSLVEQAGFDGFREARHPLGLTQRQAGGKFTKQEASTLIDQLLADVPDVPDVPETVARPRTAVAAPPRPGVTGSRPTPRRAGSVREMPAVVLADELRRRGWVVHPPQDGAQR